MADRIDRILSQWRETTTDIDPAPMELTGRLMRSTQIAQEKLQQNFSLAGLEHGWFDVLATLYRANESHTLTAGELANWVMVTGGALTNRVNRLVKAKLVTRHTDPNNRRRVLITLTPKGRTTIENILEPHLEACRSVAANLSKEEIQQLNALLKKLSAEP